jgi:DNA-binding response OmpR family regulator
VSTQPTTLPTKIAVAVADPPIARFIALALRLEGYEPQALADGQQVLTHALNESVAAVVLERGLAKLDGLDVCARLRAASSLPIVLVLQREEAYLQPRAKECGATACLVLPFDVEELLLCVRGLLPQAPQFPA